MEWYQVVKIINGRKYIYDQKTYRVGKQVKTLNRYVGPYDGSVTSKNTYIEPRDPYDLKHRLLDQIKGASKGIGDAHFVRRFSKELEPLARIGKEWKTDVITIDGRKYNGLPVVVNDNEVGAVNYRVYPNELKTIELSRIEIYPEHRGNNYARSVIDRIFKENPDSQEMSLNAVKSALPIWERLGFKPIGHITEQGPVYKISRTDFYDKVHST